MNLPAYRTHVRRPVGATPRVLVIGAGMAGLACARTLHDHGLSVTVLDKSRGVGGRLSARREGVWQFDHGAPAFRLDDRRTAPFAASWQADGVLQAQADGAFIGARGMNTLPKHLATDLTVRTGVQVASMTRDGARWTVTDATGNTHTADIVVLATPAPQAVTLLGTSPDTADVAAALAGVRMLPCWSTMVVFDAPPSAAMTASLRDGLAESDDPRVHRAWRQSVRPGRLPDEAWVVHSEGAWSAEQVEATPAEIAALVSEALRARLAVDGAVVHAVAHRWRYARVASGLDDACLFDAAHGVGACGDWGEAGATRRVRTSVERAWLSGVALAGRVLGR